MEGVGIPVPSLPLTRSHWYKTNTRCLRRDKMTDAMQAFVVDVMGQFFVEPPTFNLKSCYEDSSVTMPLIFVLSTGSDPNKVTRAKNATESRERARRGHARTPVVVASHRMSCFGWTRVFPSQSGPKKRAK